MKVQLIFSHNPGIGMISKAPLPEGTIVKGVAVEQRLNPWESEDFIFLDCEVPDEAAPSKQRIIFLKGENDKYPNGWLLKRVGYIVLEGKSYEVSEFIG